MSAADTLTAELRAEVKILEEDLRQRLAVSPDVKADWTRQHTDASTVGRTAISWEEWSSERITQAAVAWVLTTVFIRFAEDNGLVKPVWISGPPARRAETLNAQSEFMRTRAQAGENPTDRDWLLEAIKYLSGLPTTKALVDETSAMWLITPSGDAAGRLLAFWRERDESGELRRDLRDEKLDTRFLGDLYQDLSEEAKSRYALLQTPDFVEEFILDRTLEPALKERALEGFKVIDPTCGSGHFLLGAFARLLERWEEHAPGMERRSRVQEALKAIHGVDLNPFAVAIARFRLTIAALEATEEKVFDGGNPVVFKLHLAAGDSLLHGLDQQEIDYGVEHHTDRTVGNHAYPTENLKALGRILENGQYDAVVGNPPYITVKDKALNAAYRDRYKYLKGTYALTVPFMERFFALAKQGERAGWVGQITSNSFMKREFGVPLIEKFFPTKDLRLVADTSGAFIPGHGTPTLILVGRNSRPIGRTVRAVLGVRGEPGRPDVAADGLVWSAITRNVDNPGTISNWVSVVDLDIDVLSRHPWALSGGGAIELRQAIEKISSTTLRGRGFEVGGLVTTGEDAAYEIGGRASLIRNSLPGARPLIAGEEVKDYVIRGELWVAFPYDDNYRPLDEIDKAEFVHLWPMRTILKARRRFGVPVGQIERFIWSQYRELYVKRLGAPAVAVFVKISTHNHAAMSPPNTLFREACHAIVGSSVEMFAGILPVLNSSTACFWLKQNSHGKGNGGVNEGFRGDDWEEFYEFSGTTLQDFPLPRVLPMQRGRVLDELAQRLAGLTPEAVAETRAPVQQTLKEAHQGFTATRAQMIAQQEELDWEVYRLYGLVDEDLTYSRVDLPDLALGERAFEIALARRMRDDEEKTAWFARHGSTAIAELPERLPAAYRDLIQRRIELIASHPYLKLLERPENKRRWAVEPWEKQEERALRGWLLDRLEDRRFWFDRSGTPITRSVAHLADEVARDQDMASVLTLWEGRPDVSVAASLEKLLAREAVPFLAAYRYKEGGLRKRAAWEHTWALQRREDAGEKFGKDNPIPVPPKYTSADFARKEYWDNRGKLDVPKERFILYPDTGRETDASPVLGWAGWDHAQQAFALDQLIIQGETDGWPDERLIPLVAGLAELLPWVEQWHQGADDFYGGESAASFVGNALAERMQQVERTREQLAAWRPQPARRGRRTAK